MRLKHTAILICLCLPVGIMSAFAISALTAVKDAVARSELIRQTKLLNTQIGTLRDHLDTARTHASIARTTLDVLRGKRSIWDVFHYRDILGWESEHLVWNLSGLYYDIENIDEIPDYYGHLWPAYERVIDDYRGFRQDVARMTLTERRDRLAQLETKSIESPAVIITQTHAISETLANGARAEINKLSEQLQTDPDTLSTNDLLFIIAANGLIANRVASHHLQLYALIENKEAELRILQNKIKLAKSKTPPR